MKHLTLLLTTLILSFAAPVNAAEDSQSVKVEQAVQSGDVHVSVNGLVCDFCARALEKVFGEEEAVKAIDVNLDTKIITVNFNEGQTLSDEKITQLVTDAGYNVEGIHRVE
jgi:copper chaperone CopZ